MNPLSPAPFLRLALAGLIFLGPAPALAQQRPEYDRTLLLITQEDSLTVELVGLYWHFVDIVWIVIFTVVYLIPTGP